MKKKIFLRLAFTIIGSILMAVAWADTRLVLAYPGDELSMYDRPKKMKLSTWITSQRWSALSLKDNVLSVKPATETVASDWIDDSGKKLKQFVSLKVSPDTVVLAKVIDVDSSLNKTITSGRYSGYIAPTILRVGWSASAEIAGTKWTFFTHNEKSSDGKMLAGSMEIIAKHGNNQNPIVLLPKASGMAFSKQELLWLGDLNSDLIPDLLLKRTWLTGEIDIVLVVGRLRESIYHDPDLPNTSFSSGVEPDSDGSRRNKRRPIFSPEKFLSKDSFSITSEEWAKKLNPNSLIQNGEEPQQSIPDEPLSRVEVFSLPILLADRRFKLKGENIRFTLEYLPRVRSDGDSSAYPDFWRGDVVVRAFFRGKSQVLMEANGPDDGIFKLSIGTFKGEPSIRIDDQPHYNNSFTRYWVFDKDELRFRRVLIDHSQGC